MRRLGQQLGVEAMALYRHFGNKEDLLDGLVDVVVTEIDPPESGTDWTAIMRRRVLSARQALLRHPWASEVIISRQNATPTMLAYMDSMAGILRRGGFSVDLTHHALHLLGSRILGFVQELYNDSDSVPQDPEVMAMLRGRFALEYPYIDEIVGQVIHDQSTTVGKGCDDQWEFEFGLDLILEGLERIRARNAAVGSVAPQNP